MPVFDHIADWNMAILPVLNSAEPGVSSPMFSATASSVLIMSPNMSSTSAASGLFI